MSFRSNGRADDGDVEGYRRRARRPRIRSNEIMMRSLWWCVGIIPVMALPVAALEVNLVANGDFSAATDGQPREWATSGSPAHVSQTLRVEHDDSGKPFARLVCTRCEGQGGDTHAMLAQNGMVALKRNQLYRFSCRLRATGLKSRTVGVAIQETQGWLPTGLFTEFTLSPAWQPYETLFRATRDVGPTGRLQIWFAEPGTLDVADVAIVEVTAERIVPTDTIAATEANNLVPNGSFELGGTGWSSMGAGIGWGDFDHLHGTIHDDGGTHGDKFLRIALGDDRTPVLYFDYFEPQVKRERRVLAATVGWIHVEKGAAYTIGCDLRASADHVRAVLGVRTEDPADGSRNDCSQTVELTTAWRRYSHTFRPEHEWLFVFAGPDLVEEGRVHVDIDAVQLEKAERATSFEPRSEVEFAIEPKEPAGIFVEGESAALALRVRNHAATPAAVSLEVQATDYADQPLALPPLSLEVPPQRLLSREVVLPADWRGYYHLHATARCGDASAAADLRLVIVPRPTAGDSVCGINHAFVSARQIRLAAKAGVTWYRDWSLKWQHIEPSPGKFLWERGDVQLDRVLREGVRVLPLLPPFPSAGWNSDAPATLADGSGYPESRLRASFAPVDPRGLEEFVGKAVRRYKDRIHVWEFLNEPVYTSYALSADRENRLGGKHYAPADYVALLGVAARGMRAADPTCKVLGGIAGPPKTLTREVIEAGCLQHVDIFNLHIYPGKRAPESYVPEMQELLALMDAHGGRKPIWMTEFSYYGTDILPRRPFIPRPDNWSEERLLADERQCADYTVRFFLVMLAHGVEKVFLHSGASGRVNDPNFECALFDYGSAPRKLFAALAVLTHLVGERPECVGQSPLGQYGQVVAFETGHHALIAVWSEAGAGDPPVALPADEHLQILDVVGRPLPLDPVALSSSPTYLLGPSGQARRLFESLVHSCHP
jgi:hypothetical protein